MKTERPPTMQYMNAQGTKQLTLTLWKKSPSCNEWTYGHWKKYHRIKTEWRQRLGLVLNGSIEFKQARIKAYRHGIHVLDYENAVAGLKPITDALVYWRLIQDDSPKYLPEAPKVEQTKVSKRCDERTILIIEELQ